MCIDKQSKILSVYTFYGQQSLRKRGIDSLSSKILVHVFNVMCKNFVAEINPNVHTSKYRIKTLSQKIAVWSLKQIFKSSKLHLE